MSLFSKNTKETMETSLISQKVIDDSKSLNGTWSPDYLASVSDQLKNLKTNSIDNFVEDILNYSAEEKTTNEAKLKIAQLLMSLKSFFLPKISLSLANEYDLLENVLESVHEGKLKDATIKSYTNIMSTIKSKPIKVSTKHKKSNSVQPTSESTKFELQESMPPITSFII